LHVYKPRKQIYATVLTNFDALMTGSFVIIGASRYLDVAAISRSCSSGMSCISEADLSISRLKGSKVRIDNYCFVKAPLPVADQRRFCFFQRDT
jgi:hypothetical protein